MNITKEGKEMIKQQETYQDLEDEAMALKAVDDKNNIYDMVAEAERLIYEHGNDQTLGSAIRELFKKW